MTRTAILDIFIIRFRQRLRFCAKETDIKVLNAEEKSRLQIFDSKKLKGEGRVYDTSKYSPYREKSIE